METGTAESGAELLCKVAPIVQLGGGHGGRCGYNNDGTPLCNDGIRRSVRRKRWGFVWSKGGGYGSPPGAPAGFSGD